MSSTSEERADVHIAAAVSEIIKGNNRADGDYVIVISPSVTDGACIYTWQWFWSPRAPERTGTL